MNERSRLLLIAYYFPPLGMGGVQRPLKLAKYLPEFGWDVTVITVAQPAYHVLDLSLVSELPSSVTVRPVKVPDPGHWLKLHAREGIPSGQRHNPPPSWVRKVQQIARWPDDKFPFVKPAVRAASRMIAENPFDVVITTSPPPSVHGIGLYLQKKHNLPWIADFRDPWLVQDGDWGPTRFHERYAKRLRTQFIESADAVIAANNAIAAGWGSLRSKRPIEVIHNGYDEADFEAGVSEPANTSDFRILFYGTLAPVVDPTPALRLIAAWRARNPHRSLRITHVGLSVGVDAEAIARSCGLDDVYESIGYLPHRDAVAHLCQADAIILPLTNKPGFESTVPGRLFEAMRSLRPILFVGPSDGEAAQILRPVENAWTISPGDEAGGIAALDEFTALPQRAPAREIASISQYDRREQAGKVAALMESLKRERQGRDA
jgi:glycosyltransferase involved in cell wall biosynthesis